MPWNTEVEYEYDLLISYDIGKATDFFPVYALKAGVEPYLIDLETGVSPLTIKLTPSHDSYLTENERIKLHLMRVACALYAERNAIFPWRLVDLSEAELRPLLSYHYMGLFEDEPGKHKFHHVWDVEPGLRMVVAALCYILSPLFGFEMPATASGMTLNRIQWMRDIGWEHMLGKYEDYAGYHDHGENVYDFDIATQVKRSGCHMTADYLVAVLRHFNLPAHYGRGWEGAQPTGSAYWNNIHQCGHCFIHFSAANGWYSHADHVYSDLCETLPPDVAMRSDYWMETYHFDKSEYTWLRANTYENWLWWCGYIGQCSDPYYDVHTLYANETLRDRLENLHIEYDLASRDGAPAVVPPVFDDDEVDALMGWVAYKIN